MNEKLQKVIIYLLVIQILVTFWGVWYMATNPERQLQEKCRNFVGSWVKANPQLDADWVEKIYNGCYEQGGGNEWQQSNDVRQTRDNTNDILNKLGG